VRDHPVAPGGEPGGREDHDRVRRCRGGQGEPRSPTSRRTCAGPPCRSARPPWWCRCSPRSTSGVPCRSRCTG
jgi:hypothetical protein